MFHEKGMPDPVFTDTLELDLATVEPSMAGPKRPQDRVALGNVGGSFVKDLAAGTMGVPGDKAELRVPVAGANYDLGHGDVVIAAITSCTNTSNPYVLVAAGLVAKKAVEKGLTAKPWVKTSLAPGSQVVTEYLNKSGLHDLPRCAGLPDRGLWLHHLHRQFRPARRTRSWTRSRTTSWS
jgi:aconitate hydratase